MIFERSFLPKNSYVIIDSREGPKSNDTYYHFKKGTRPYNVEKFFGHENIIVKQLQSADYVLMVDGECKVGIEYKTVPDLISSVMDGRIFKQTNDMINTYPIHYIMVEGDIDDYIDRMKYYNKKIYFTKKSWLGVKSSLLQSTKFDLVKDEEEGIQSMNLLFKKAVDGKNKTFIKRKKLKNNAMTWIANTDGLGEKTATLVCNELELSTLKDLLGVTKDDLLDIKGIKHEKANKIMATIE